MFNHLQPLLRCPNCHHDTLHIHEQELMCPACHAVYPIVNGVIRLLAERDRPLAQHAFSPLAARLYDLLAARGGFRRLYASDIETEFEAFTHDFHINSDDVVVDVGCGTGNYTIEFAKRTPDGLAIGVDLSEGMLGLFVKHAQGEGVKNVIAIQANAENLPFKDASIPKMFNGCLHHMARNIAPSLNEARRCICGELYGVTIFMARSALTRWLQGLMFIGQKTKPLNADSLILALKDASFDYVHIARGGLRKFFFGSYHASANRFFRGR
jgi:ubiquinone/menaquinone biosynthesis C-methylase UbiE